MLDGLCLVRQRVRGASGPRPTVACLLLLVALLDLHPFGGETDAATLVYDLTSRQQQQPHPSLRSLVSPSLNPTPAIPRPKTGVPSLMRTGSAAPRSFEKKQISMQRYHTAAAPGNVLSYLLKSPSSGFNRAMERAFPKPIPIEMVPSRVSSYQAGNYAPKAYEKAYEVPPEVARRLDRSSPNKMAVREGTPRTVVLPSSEASRASAPEPSSAISTAGTISRVAVPRRPVPVPAPAPREPQIRYFTSNVRSDMRVYSTGMAELPDQEPAREKYAKNLPTAVERLAPCGNTTCALPARCLRGQCKCPVAFTGPTCRIKRKEVGGCLGSILGSSFHWIVHSRPSQILYLANWTTCAVVGNAPSGANLGKLIDSHSAVIRMNEAPTKGYERAVGSKTTLRVQNREHCGFAERNEMCMWYTPTEGHSWKTASCSERMSVSKCHRIYPAAPARLFALNYWKVCHARDGGGNGSGRGVRGSGGGGSGGRGAGPPIDVEAELAGAAHTNRGDEDEEAAEAADGLSDFTTSRRLLQQNAPRGGRDPCKPAKLSSGFFAVLLALHVCTQVNVFQFDGANGHYYTKSYKGYRQFEDRHFWDAERECMETRLRTFDRDHVAFF